MAFDNQFGSNRSKKGLKYELPLYRLTDDETGSKSNRNPNRDTPEVFRKKMEEVSSASKGSSSASQSASTGVPQEKLPDYYAKGKDGNYITDKDGKKVVNPDYKSGRGGSVLSAIRQNRGLMTGNQFNDAGVMIGSAIGGLFNKDLRGQEQYEVDTAAINERNKQAMITTEAAQRLQMQAAQMAKINEQTQTAIWQREFKSKVQATKERKDRISLSRDILKTETDPEKRQTILGQLSADGVDISDLGAESKAHYIGGKIFLDDGHGNISQAIDEETGQPWSTDSWGTYIDNLKKLGVTPDKAPLDEALINRAKALVKDLPFNNSGQKSVQVLNVAKQLALTGGEQGIKVKLPDGTIREISAGDIPMPSGGVAPSTGGGSQFMPEIGAEGGVIKVPVPSGLGSNDAAVIQKDASFIDPKTVSTPTDFTNADVEAEIQKAANNPALNKALSGLSEGGTFKASKTIKGKKRIVTFTKQNGKIEITDVQ